LRTSALNQAVVSPGGYVAAQHDLYETQVWNRQVEIVQCTKIAGLEGALTLTIRQETAITLAANADRELQFPGLGVYRCGR